MRLGMAVFGIAALVGVGYAIGKKVIERRREDEDFYDFGDFDEDERGEEDEIDVGVYTKESYGNKIKKASLFAVGAIKTGADKLGETIHDIKNKDMVKKGEQTVGAVKETGDNIKNDIKRDIEELKNMVSSLDEEENASGNAPATDSDSDEAMAKDLFGDSNNS
ncbi:MAG: hypothetical protein FWG83_00495 [Oscillospiraceae bacterium]|nr:hypothetical protein [Oscillospiraceae bacterium]